MRIFLSIGNYLRSLYRILFLLDTFLVAYFSFFLFSSISPVSALHSLLAKDSNEGKSLLLDGGSWPLPLIMARLLPLLIKGLGKRVKLLTFRPFESAQVIKSCIGISKCTANSCAQYYTLHEILVTFFCSGWCLKSLCVHVTVM